MIPFCINSRLFIWLLSFLISLSFWSNCSSKSLKKRKQENQNYQTQKCQRFYQMKTIMFLYSYIHNIIVVIGVNNNHPHYYYYTSFLNWKHTIFFAVNRAVSYLTLVLASLSIWYNLFKWSFSSSNSWILSSRSPFDISSFSICSSKTLRKKKKLSQIMYEKKRQKIHTCTLNVHPEFSSEEHLKFPGFCLAYEKTNFTKKKHTKLLKLNKKKI